MFLSGLATMDFEGLWGLSGDMSRGELFSRFRNALSSGITDAEINSILSQVLSVYEIQKTKVTSDLAKAVSGKVADIVISVLGEGALIPGTGYARAGLEKAKIDAVVKSLTDDGYALVPIGYSTLQQTVPSSGPSTASVTAPGETIAVQRTPASSGAPGPTGPQTSAAPQRSGGLPIRRITRSFVRTAAEKQRLLWIVGGFGVIFALAIGVMAARSGD